MFTVCIISGKLIIDMNDEFSKLYIYLNQRFDALDNAVSTKADKSDVESVKNAVDGLYGQIDTLDIESTAMSAHLIRIDETLADHTTRFEKHIA